MKLKTKQTKRKINFTKIQFFEKTKQINIEPTDTEREKGYKLLRSGIKKRISLHTLQTGAPGGSGS